MYIKDLELKSLPNLQELGLGVDKLASVCEIVNLIRERNKLRSAILQKRKAADVARDEDGAGGSRWSLLPTRRSAASS